ncbi:uncharacterized protein [Branchiostoma lanceolatum]|uniref:uncharacterized protein isoform X1 n=1 Tax=Branchiostoma lanceolatum TaxID=7740 RepID=UPI0034556C25
MGKEKKKRFSRCKKESVKVTKVTLDGGPRRRQTKQVRRSSTRTPSHPKAGASTTPGHPFQSQDPQDPEPELPRPQGRYENQRQKELESWTKVRELLFETSIELLAPLSHSCSICGEGELDRLFRCRECGPTAVFCADCLEKQHCSSFHVPDIWEDNHFHPHQHNKSMQLPHHARCASKHRKLVKVFDAAGRLYYWELTFCHCEPASCTLLKYGLWGATVTDPQTAYATSLLDWLVPLTLEAQVSVEAFCRTVRFKNDLSLSEMNTLYKSLIGQPITEYRNLTHRVRTLNDLCPQLDDGTTCPACPKEKGTQIIALDGNFGLVRKSTSGKSIGPPLHGTTMFIDDGTVREFLDPYNDENRPDEDCNNFKAGNSIRSQTKQSKLDVTGVFGSVCRHEIPRRFLNMRHGERLGYPVLLIKRLLSEVEGTEVKLNIIYDISCVLESHLIKTEQYELLAKLTLALDVFHAYGHKTPCQLKYSTRRRAGFGLTDGESVERLWAYLRRFARTTKEMSPSRRIDLLTDALIHYSMRKTIDMEVTLVKKLETAKKVGSIAQEGLTSVMEDANVTMDDIKAWSLKEKEAIESREKPQPSTFPKWQREYVTKLLKVKAVRNKILANDDGSDAAVSHALFAQLDKQLKEMEKKHKVATRWDESSKDFQDITKEVDWTTRSSLLSKMRSLAYERSFLRSLKRKYPEGQTIASKLSDQLKTASSKLKKTIDDYNTVEWDPTDPKFPLTVEFREATDSSWQHYACLDPTVLEEPGLPRSLQRKAIDHLNLLQRATEEVEMVQQEMKNVFYHFQTQHELTENALTALGEADNDGRKAALTTHMLRLQKRFITMYHFFSHHVPHLDLPILPSSCLALFPFKEPEDGDEMFSDTLSGNESALSDEENDDIE